jgi:hypothetical protein
MSFIKKMFGQSKASESLPTDLGITDTMPQSASGTSAEPSGQPDGLPPLIECLGMKALCNIQLSALEEDLDSDDSSVQLPVALWGYFDRALVHEWANELVLIGSNTLPPSLSQIRALFDDLHAHFGIDGHGDGPFNKKDLSQWAGVPLGLEHAGVFRAFYFYGENLGGLRYQKDNPFSKDDISNKPSIMVTIKPTVDAPEYDCSIQLKHWDKIKARFLQA